MPNRKASARRGWRYRSGRKTSFASGRPRAGRCILPHEHRLFRKRIRTADRPSPARRGGKQSGNRRVERNAESGLSARPLGSRKLNRNLPRCFTARYRPGGLHRKSRSLLRELPQGSAERGPRPGEEGCFGVNRHAQPEPGCLGLWGVRNTIEAGRRRQEPRKDSPNPWFGGRNRVNGKSRPGRLGHPTRSPTRVRSFGEG